MTNKRQLSILIDDQVYRWLEAVIRNKPESFLYPKSISTVEELGAFAVESFVNENTEQYAPLPDELPDTISDKPIAVMPKKGIQETTIEQKREYNPSWHLYPTSSLEESPRLIIRRNQMRNEALRLFQITSRIDNFTIYQPSYAKNCISCQLSNLIKVNVYSYTYDNFPVYWQFDPDGCPRLSKSASNMDSSYAQAIKNYEKVKDDQYIDMSRQYIDELFFEEEGKALLEYLNQGENVKSAMTEMQLPLEDIYAPSSFLEGDRDYHVIHLGYKDALNHQCENTSGSHWWRWPFPNYTLPFHVSYYFCHLGGDKEAILKEEKELEILVDKSNPGDWRVKCMKEMELIPAKRKEG